MSMSNVSREEIVKLAKLSKIALSEDEIAMFQREIEEILVFIEQLKAIDTDGVEPTYQVSGISRTISDLRPDEIEPQLTQEELMKNVANKSDGYIKVPRVL